MPVCLGCSQSFKFLDAAQCEPCSDALASADGASKPKSEWPACSDCSKRFQFLTTVQCFSCKEKESRDSRSMPPPSSNPPGGPLLIQDQNRYGDIQHAMRNPTNPRTHGEVPYHNPFHLQRAELNKNDPRYTAAQTIFEDFQSGYVDAVARVHPHTRVSKSKFRGAENAPLTVKAVHRINVVVRKITNRNSRTLNTPFDAQMNTYEETKLWSEIEANIVIWLDGIYSRVHNHRIRTCDEITVHYNHGRCQIDPILTSNVKTMLKDVWKKAIEQPSVLVLVKHQKTSVLELDVHVDYPPKFSKQPDEDLVSDFSDSEQNCEKVSVLANRPQKRARNVELDSDTGAIRPYKHRASGRTSSYFTNITGTSLRPNANQEGAMVVKLTALLEATNDGPHARWHESEETFNVIIDKIPFDNGRTKKIFKLRFTNSSTVYAAKFFYDISSGAVEAVSAEDNLQLLKEELVRQLAIQAAVKAFNQTAEESKIAIYDLQFADSFILKSKDVPEADDGGKAWLVDPLLDSTRMRKFSGTNRAGANTDFAGKTCDVFAHFALIDSGLEFVPTDIQGIDTNIIRNRIQGANAITLFDLMAHSRLQTMGLGDDGLEGIRLFCKQHKCNSICHNFDLPKLSTIDLGQAGRLESTTTDNGKGLEEGEIVDNQGQTGANKRVQSLEI